MVTPNWTSISRLGLPLGTCLILCALVETAISLYEVGMDVVSLFAVHWNNTEFIQYFINSPTVMALNVALFLQIFADILFLWIGTILKGNRVLLASWISITLVSVLVLNVVWVHYVYMDEDNKTAWMSAVYTVVLYSLFYVYIISVACQCFRLMKDDIEELQPIGMGFERIWKFFSKNVASGARLLLLTGLILDSYFFLSRKLPPVVFDRDYSGHEDDNSAPIILEEIVIRGIRIILDAAGIIILTKGKQRWMQYWCIPYLITIFLSFAIFMYVAFGWVAEHPIFTYGYILFFAVSMCFRVILFALCFAFSQSTSQEIGDFAFVTEFS